MHSQGLPIGAQLVGHHFEDEALIETARLAEEVYDFVLPLPDVDQPASCDGITV